MAKRANEQRPEERPRRRTEPGHGSRKARQAAAQQRRRRTSRPASRPRWRSSPSSRSSRSSRSRDPWRPRRPRKARAPRGRDPARARLDLRRGRVWYGRDAPDGPSERDRPPHRGREARSALHRCRVLPLLRRPTLAVDRRAQPLRSFQRLGATASSPSDWFPNTQTFSFHGRRHERPPVVQRHGDATDTGAPLDQPTAAEQALFQQYDAAPYTTAPGSTRSC